MTGHDDTKPLDSLPQIVSVNTSYEYAIRTARGGLCAKENTAAEAARLTDSTGRLHVVCAKRYSLGMAYMACPADEVPDGWEVGK